MVKRRSGLPYCMRERCVFGRDERLITRRGMIMTRVAVVSSLDAENGYPGVSQTREVRYGSAGATVQRHAKGPLSALAPDGWVCLTAERGSGIVAT